MSLFTEIMNIKKIFKAHGIDAEDVKFENFDGYDIEPIALQTLREIYIRTETGYVAIEDYDFPEVFRHINSDNHAIDYDIYEIKEMIQEAL